MMKILAIDWGGRRIGTALAHSSVRIASPAGAIPQDESALKRIAELVTTESVERVVVGLPRNLSGEETPQSATVRQFAAELEEAIDCEVVLQDETLSTQAASALKAIHPKADIDSLAATVILEDYLTNL